MVVFMQIFKKQYFYDRFQVKYFKYTMNHKSITFQVNGLNRKILRNTPKYLKYPEFK